MRIWPRSLTARLLASCWLLSSVTVGLVGGIAFWRTRDALRSAAFDRLSVIADLKEDALQVWVDAQRDATVALAALPSITTQADVLMSRPETSVDYQTARDLLTRSLVSAATSRPELVEIVLLTDVGGKVILSTNSAREGEY